MNPDNYVPCGARLSQGDLVRAPVGIFVPESALADPAMLDAEGPAVPFGDPRGIARSLPRLVVGTEPLVLRAWYWPAVVVSPDCAIDKQPAQVLLAPVLPLHAYTPQDQDGLRAGTFLAAFDLPPDPELALADGSRTAFPHAAVDLARSTTVSPELVLRQRMVALGERHVDRLHAAWVRYVAGRELSSTGTVAAAVGKRVARVKALESSKKRHSVLMTFEDGTLLVLYQEPRRAGAHLESVRVRDGVFEPARLQALAGTNLILRFENEDRRDWDAGCPALWAGAQRLPGGATTELLAWCPDEPDALTVTNLRKRSSTLLLEVVALPEAQRPPASKAYPG